MAKDFIKVTLKGEDFTFTALNFGQLQELEQDFETLKGLTDGMPTAVQRAAVVSVVHASVSCKHPSVTRAALTELLTLANIGAALKAVVGVSELADNSAVAGNA